MCVFWLHGKASPLYALLSHCFLKIGGLGPCCSIHMQYFEPTFCKNQTHKIHFLFQNLIFTQILPCFSLQWISKERKVNCWFYLSVWNQIFWSVVGKRWCNQMKISLTVCAKVTQIISQLLAGNTLFDTFIGYLLSVADCCTKISGMWPDTPESILWCLPV